MTHPNAAKGKRFELSVFQWLLDRFGRRLVQRPHQEGFKDVGDIHFGPWALQLKDEARLNFPSYVDDAEKQAGHADLEYGAAVVKRRQKGVERAYVVMSLETFARHFKAEQELAAALLTAVE